MHRRQFDFEEEENILIEKATKRKEEEQLKKATTEKNYELRLNLMEKYFLRMSSVNKEKFTLKLLENFNDVSNVLEIANFISVGDAKPFVYSSVYHQTNYTYDKNLLDHNRCLDEKDLEETIQNDLEWFRNLTSDQQVDVIISIIKHAGGTTQKNLFLPILKKCFHKKKVRNAETDAKKTEPAEDEDSNKVKYYESSDTIMFHDHPSTTEVENQRRNWNQMISKYREKVQGAKQPVSKDKPGKDKEKKVKQSKKDDKADGGSIDWIQLLPIWDVKKIFNYFDQKTLQKLKKVNAYWSYVAQDVLKERKMRAQLDKEIEKLKSQISPQTLAEAFEEEQIKEAGLKRAPKEKKRRVINYERGAIVKELVPKPTHTMVQTSLIADVTAEVTEDFFPENIVSFSREISDEATTYKYQPCFLRDVHVVVGDQEDINERKSFVTYTLDTQSGSIILPVDRQTLDEW